MNVLLSTMPAPLLDNEFVYPSLGVLYLQRALNDADVNCDITDDFKFEEPHEYIDYDFMAASVMTPQRNDGARFLEIAEFLGTKSIIGGSHPTFYHDDVKDEGWNHIVQGPGESKLVEIVTGIKTKQQFVRPTRLENAELLSKYEYTLKGKRGTSLITGTGCPMSCGFCEAADTKIEYVPLKQVEQELDDIVELGYNAVYIFDDLFALNKKRSFDIGDMMKDRGLTFRCNGHAKNMTRDFAEGLAERGLVEIAYGPESGSQRILDIINKKTTVQQNYDFVRHFEGTGVDVKCFLMIGLPSEDKQSIHETEMFIQNTNISDFQLSLFYPYKGTPIRENIDKYDLQIISEGTGAYGVKGGASESTIRTSSLSAEELQFERDRIVKKYKPKSHKNMWEDL